MSSRKWTISATKLTQKLSKSPYSFAAIFKLPYVAVLRVLVFGLMEAGSLEKIEG